MPVFAIIYTYDDRTEHRMRVRPAHRDFLAGLLDDGVLLAAGAWGDDERPGGLLIARAENVAAIEAALDPDPYRAAGVLTNREIRLWNPVFGPWTQ